ncbi:MAG: phage holin family protein [Pirellulaceae bacterium]
MSNDRNQSGFGRVINDIVDLCELQIQLLSVDSQEAKRRGVKAIICLAFAAIVALTAAMTAVVGLGFVLHEQYDLTVGQALLIVSGGTILIALLAAYLGIKLIRKANDSLSEVKSEFAENMRWIKAVVLKPDQSPRNQLRRETFSPMRR